MNQTKQNREFERGEITPQEYDRKVCDILHENQKNPKDTIKKILEFNSKVKIVVPEGEK